MKLFCQLFQNIFHWTKYLSRLALAFNYMTDKVYCIDSWFYSTKECFLFSFHSIFVFDEMREKEKNEKQKNDISKKTNLEYVCKSIDVCNKFISSIFLYK